MGTFHVGGLERLVLDLAMASTAHGIESRVFAFMEDGAFRAAFDDAGIETRFIETRPGLSWSLPVRLAAALRGVQTDVVHAHHFAPYLYGSAACALTGLPLVYTEHSREVYDSPRRCRAARIMDKRAAAVVSVSAELQTWRRQALGTESQVVVNGVAVPPLDDGERRRAARLALDIAPDRFVVGAVARFMPEKDHATLLRAFAASEARARGLLVLVGGGPGFEAAQQLAATLGLGESVRFLGVRYDVGDLLPAFDVISLSSVREGLPLSLLEGMANGLPVAATDVGEVGTLVSGGCGEVVAAGDVPAFAAMLDGYCAQADRRVREGKAARARVMETYSRRQMVSEYVELYRAAAGKRGRR